MEFSGSTAAWTAVVCGLVVAAVSLFALIRDFWKPNAYYKWHGSWKLKAAIEKTCGYLGRESDEGSSTSHASRFPCVIEAAKRTTGSRTHVCDLVDANDPKRSKGRIAIPHFIGRVRVQWSDALFLWASPVRRRQQRLLRCLLRRDRAEIAGRA
jgi:hypothetical protein